MVRDLEITSWPPDIRLTFGLGAHLPFQAMGLSLEVEGYLGQSVRLSALYAGGIVANGSNAEFSSYAKALVGVKLLGWWGRAEADVRPPPPNKGFWGGEGPEQPVQFKAWLPSYTAFLIEAGALTGPVPMARCLTNCPPARDPALESTYAWEVPQLVYPVAGVRVVYSVGARSRTLPGINRRGLFQAFAHAIYRPFFDSRRVRYWGNDYDEVERFFVGGEGGITVPLSFKRAFSLSIAVGYLPAPATPIVEVGIGN